MYTNVLKTSNQTYIASIYLKKIKTYACHITYEHLFSIINSSSFLGNWYMNSSCNTPKWVDFSLPLHTWVQSPPLRHAVMASRIPTPYRWRFAAGRYALDRSMFDILILSCIWWNDMIMSNKKSLDLRDHCCQAKICRKTAFTFDSRSVSPNRSVCDHICRDLVAGSRKDTESFPKHQIRYWHSPRSTKDSSYTTTPKIQSRSWNWPDAKGRTFTKSCMVGFLSQEFQAWPKNPFRSLKHILMPQPGEVAEVGRFQEPSVFTGWNNKMRGIYYDKDTPSTSFLKSSQPFSIVVLSFNGIFNRV